MLWYKLSEGYLDPFYRVCQALPKDTLSPLPDTYAKLRTYRGLCMLRHGHLGTHVSALMQFWD